MFEGVHGLFHGFAHTTEGDYDALTGDFGTRWVTDTLAFKPYPCGTMAQPYIDCARRLAARGIKAEDISEIVCEVAEGTVHRLWEPLADKQRPRNGYAAKFAAPYLLAAGFVHGGVGLGAFTESAIRDPRVLALAAKVKFVIDPDNPYPNNYTGHIRATMKDGSVIEERQPYLRGGAQEPLTRQDVTDKFALNAQHGGWSKAQSDGALKLMAGLYREDRSAHSILLGRLTWIGRCMTKELTGKVAIVTGAGRNIGRAIALALAEGGASIVVNARSNRAEAEAVAREIEASGGKALVHIGDVADASAVQAMADAAVKQFGRIDILVNNAALRREKPFAEMDYRRVARDPRRHARWHVSLREGLPAGAAQMRRGHHRQYRRPERAYRREEPRPCGDRESRDHRLHPRAGPRSRR